MAPDAELDAVAAWVGRLGDDRPALQVVTVDGTRFHDARGVRRPGARVHDRRRRRVPAGAQARGVDPAAVFARIELRLAATGDQFATIAKFRAVRLLWARVAEAIGVPDAAGSTPIHAVTSTAMMTSYDPWVNTLRSTVACFAAGDRRRRRRHRAAPRPPARRRGDRARPADRPQHAVDPDRASRTSPRSSTRPAARGTSSASPTSSPTRRGAWFQELEAAGGLLPAAVVRARRRAPRGHPRRPPARRRHPPGAAHRADRVPEHPRAAAGRRQTALAPAPLVGRVRGAAPAGRRLAAPAGARPTSSWPRSARRPTFTPRLSFARNFFEVGGAGDASPARRPTTRRHRRRLPRVRRHRRLPLLQRRRLRRPRPPTWPRALEAAGADAVYIAGKPQAGIERAVSTSASTSGPR